MLCANLLQPALSPPRSSCREDLPMNPSRPPTSIDSLPVELLTWIFVLGSAFDYPYANSPFLLKPDPEQTFTPLPSYNFHAVAHVSQRWRSVALHTPYLWNTLHIREKIHVDRAMTYLARCSASTCTLDILINTVSVEDHIPAITLHKDELTSLFEALVPVVARWRTFHLIVRDYECKVVARKYLTSCGPGPKLETLQLYHFENFHNAQGLFLATHKPPVTIFDNDLPSLKNVSLIGVNLPWDESTYLSNLEHLELALHLDTVRPPYRCWDRMLRNSPNLLSLSLYFSGPRKANSSPDLAWYGIDNKIHLPKLAELSFRDLDPDFLCSLFGRLQLPSLKKLTLDLQEQDFSPFIDFLTKSAESPPPNPASATFPPSTLHQPPELPAQCISRLEILIIRSLDCGLRNWAALLLATKNLRELEVSFAKTSANFWDVFTHKGEVLLAPSINDLDQHNGRRAPALLPHLKAFKFSGITGKDILSALYYRFHYVAQSTRPSEKWTVRWSERRRRQDPELDALVDKGYWTSKGASAPVKVLFDTFDDIEEDVEEADDETPSTSEEEEDEEKDT